MPRMPSETRVKYVFRTGCPRVALARLTHFEHLITRCLTSHGVIASSWMTYFEVLKQGFNGNALRNLDQQAGTLDPRFDPRFDPNAERQSWTTADNLSPKVPIPSTADTRVDTYEQPLMSSKKIIRCDPVV